MLQSIIGRPFCFLFPSAQPSFSKSLLPGQSSKSGSPRAFLSSQAEGNTLFHCFFGFALLDAKPLGWLMCFSILPCFTGWMTIILGRPSPCTARSIFSHNSVFNWKKVLGGYTHYFNSFTVYCGASPEKLTFAELLQVTPLAKLIH